MNQISCLVRGHNNVLEILSAFFNFDHILDTDSTMCRMCTAVLTLLLARHEWAAESFVISNKFLSPDNCLWVIVFIIWEQDCHNVMSRDKVVSRVMQ